jgi:hypothetical protein
VATRAVSIVRHFSEHLSKGSTPICAHLWRNSCTLSTLPHLLTPQLPCTESQEPQDKLCWVLGYIHRRLPAQPLPKRLPQDELHLARPAAATGLGAAPQPPEVGAAAGRDARHQAALRRGRHEVGEEQQPRNLALLQDSDGGHGRVSLRNVTCQLPHAELRAS